MLLQRGANCTADVVSHVRTNKIDKDEWLWRNVIKEPLVPERHTVLQVNINFLQFYFIIIFVM